MRVTSVELQPEGSADICVLSFRDPSAQNKYNVKALVGLDADQIVSRYYGVSSVTKQKYYALSLESREVVARIMLNPDFSQSESYSDLRDNLYKFIASSRTGAVSIRFKDGLNTVALLTGTVSKFEAPHFSKVPEVQLTFNCEEGMLKAPDPVSVNVVGLDPLSTTIVDDLSTAPHGFSFEASFDSAVSAFTMEEAGSSEWIFEVTPVGIPGGDGFLAGDVLHFSSEPNDKQLYLVRSAVTTHLADVITPGSIWPIIFPGSNEFVCPAELSWTEILYYPTYWGV